MNKYWYQEQVRILHRAREKDAAQRCGRGSPVHEETDSNCLVVNAAA
ncbi:MAG: hypothetical protein ACLVAW_00620 [Eisenbergiella massiliensis]